MLKRQEDVIFAMSQITKRSNITMKVVAERAGVHLSSVSVMFNGSRSRAGISKLNRQKIVAAAKENYVLSHLSCP